MKMHFNILDDERKAILPLFKSFSNEGFYLAGGTGLASISDIGGMKCSVITSRSLEKDYVDLYFILQNVSLQALLIDCAKKYPALDSSVILKSLVYFDDVIHEPIIFKEGHDVSFETTKIFLKKVVAEYFKK